MPFYHENGQSCNVRAGVTVTVTMTECECEYLCVCVCVFSGGIIAVKITASKVKYVPLPNNTHGFRCFTLKTHATENSSVEFFSVSVFFTLEKR